MLRKETNSLVYNRTDRRSNPVRTLGTVPYNRACTENGYPPSMPAFVVQLILYQLFLAWCYMFL